MIPQIVKNRWIVLLISLFLMAGCSKEGKEGKVIIRWYFPYTPDMIEAFQEIKAGFERLYPEIKVELMETTWREYTTKLKAMMVGGTAPDVIILKPEWCPSYVQKGAVIDLTPYIEKDKEFDLGDFYPNALRACYYMGTNFLFGIPADLNVYVMFYNKDIFDKEGVAYPTDDWTWKEFLEKAKKLTKFDKNGKVIQYAYVDLPWFWEEVAWANGGELFNEDMTECLVTSPEVVEALQFCGDLWEKYKVMPTLLQSQEQNFMEQFLSGKVVMTRTFPFWGKFIKKDVKWDIAPTPRWKRKGVKVEMSCLVMSSQSKYKDASWKLIKYFSSPEIYQRYFRVSNSIPPRKSLSYLINEGENLPEHNYIILDELKHARPCLQFPNEEIWRNAGQILDLFWCGKIKDAEKICQMVKKNVDEKLREYREERKSGEP